MQFNTLNNLKIFQKKKNQIDCGGKILQIKFLLKFNFISEKQKINFIGDHGSDIAC